MESSAPKRRKTSPLTALPIKSTTTTTTTPPDPPPPLHLFEADAPQNFEPTSTRASYASPTKASLSRHNPDILLRRLSSPAKARDAGEVLEGVQADALSQPQLEANSPQPDRQLREDYEHAASLQQRSAAHQLRSPARHLGGTLAARPRRTSLKPNPRPLPPPGPDDDDDDVLDPFAGRVLRRSPLAGLPEPDPPEPDLPPTPVHPDQAASTPPTGIHSTPSRRPRRSRALAERIRSSPTKRPPAKPAAAVFRHEDEHILPTTETEPQSAFVQPHYIQSGRRKGAKARSIPRPSAIRGVESADGEEERKRERDALRIEVARLEHDLDVVAQENERIRRLQLSKKEALTLGNTSDIFDVLERHLAHKNKDFPASPPAAWLSAALDPIAFLPFGRPSSTLPPLFREDLSTAEPEDEPISHHPLPLTGQEALPFLQAFTPLMFTSRITIDPYLARDATNDEARNGTALLQHHSITAKSASAPGLFSTRIDLTVNAKTHAITSLVVPSIDPPLAAAELSPLISKILTDPEALSNALSRNVGVLTWAMGSWLRVAIRRAKVWRTLDRELGTPDALIRTAARVRSARKGRKQNQKIGSVVDEHFQDAGGNDSESDGSTDWVSGLVNTDDLLPYMGRLWMDFPVPSLAQGGESGVTTDTNVTILRVQWHIEFDWTGEATSQIRALANLPGKCKTCLQYRLTGGDMCPLANVF